MLSDMHPTCKRYHRERPRSSRRGLRLRNLEGRQIPLHRTVPKSRQLNYVATNGHQPAGEADAISQVQYWRHCSFSLGPA